MHIHPFLPGKIVEIVVLFQDFVIKEQMKTGNKTGKLFRTHSLILLNRGTRKFSV